MRRMIRYLLGLALALGVGLWLWKPWARRVTLTVSEIYDVKGEHHAKLVLENRSSQPVFYGGIEDAPLCHFSERTPEGVIIDGGSHPVDIYWRKPPKLPPGKRLVFRVRLLHPSGKPIVDPFRAAINLLNSPHPPPPSPFRNIPILGNWLSPEQTLLWTPESQ